MISVPTCHKHGIEFSVARTGRFLTGSVMRCNLCVEEARLKYEAAYQCGPRRPPKTLWSAVDGTSIARYFALSSQPDASAPQP